MDHWTALVIALGLADRYRQIPTGHTAGAAGYNETTFVQTMAALETTGLKGLGFAYLNVDGELGDSINTHATPSWVLS